jgi:large conductance mechanosensitive channel
MAHTAETEHPVVERARKMTSFDGFKKFLLRGNLVDLAVAVVVGGAFGLLVKALTTDLINPLIAAIAGKRDFSQLYFTIHNSRFMYGDFINNLESFAIIAGVVYYFVVLPVGRMLEHFEPTPDAPAPTRDCPHCISKIPEMATVCAFCTRDVEAPQEEEPIPVR